MPGFRFFFEAKKSKQDIEDEYAVAYLALKLTVQAQIEQLAVGEEVEPEFFITKPSSISQPVPGTKINIADLKSFFVEQILEYSQRISMLYPYKIPLLTKILTAANNAMIDPSFKNIGKLMSAAHSLSRMDGAYKHLTLATTGLSAVLFATGMFLTVMSLIPPVGIALMGASVAGIFMAIVFVALAERRHRSCGAHDLIQHVEKLGGELKKVVRF
jgi:hypothetical protein